MGRQGDSGLMQQRGKGSLVGGATTQSVSILLSPTLTVKVPSYWSFLFSLIRAGDDYSFSLTKPFSWFLPARRSACLRRNASCRQAFRHAGVGDILIMANHSFNKRVAVKVKKRRSEKGPPFFNYALIRSRILALWRGSMEFWVTPRRQQRHCHHIDPRHLQQRERQPRCST